MNLRLIEAVLLGLLVVVVPYVRVPTDCSAPHGSLASVTSQVERSGPSSDGSGCGSDTKAPHFTTGCSACGVALLPDQVLLPEEAFWHYGNPDAPLTIASPLSSYWHPPA
jgi:hypothetical protein